MRPCIARGALAASLMVMGSGCLEPLVDDVPGASPHVLPAGSQVPSITQNASLTGQIVLNDGVDDTLVGESGGEIPRGGGFSDGAPVRYWSFGPASPAPSPMYVFYEETTAGLREIGHPPLVDGLPGDPGYSAVHSVFRVLVTPAYAGQLITTPEALADAIDLGLISEPEQAGLFVASPIVIPGATLEVGAAGPARPDKVYVHGYEAGMFRFGGMLGVQPIVDLLPTRQVTFLREAMKATYAAKPIFQATIPVQPPGTVANYTPVSVVVRVDLIPGVSASSITRDDQLFTRSGGEITATAGVVARFEITPALLLLPLQFSEGSP